jgi:ubiquinone/menaquinone biosynthesis C-methylase UbiE
MRRRLAARPELVRRERLSVIDAAVERLPFDTGRFDVVVSTLVLCSVADPRAAVAELRRVLRPGGRLVLLEHVAADESDRRRWQGRVEPVWKRLAGNCHLTRDTAQTLVDGGFVLDVRRDSMRKALPWVRPTIRGTARPA